MSSIIELGEVRDEQASVPPTRRPRVAGRPLRCAAVLLLALVVLAGATPAPQRTVTVVPASSDAQSYLAEDGVFVVDPATPTGDRYLTAYALPSPTGDAVRRRWQAPLAGVADYLDVRAERGLVLLIGVSAAVGVVQTTALDAATGQQRWQLQGVAEWTTDGGLLLMSGLADGPGSVRRVAPDTGRAGWSVPVPPPGEPGYHRGTGGVDEFVLVQPTGEVQVHDAGTGRLVRSVDTLPGDRSAAQRVEVVGDVLLLVSPGSTQVVAYGLPGLDPLWTAEVPLVAYAVDCDDLLCLVQQTGGMQVLDPATGMLRWSNPDHDTLADVRHDRLLVLGPDQRYAVRDAATGRVRTDLGRWDLAPVLRRDGPLIGMRPGAGGRLVVAELDLAAGRPRILDVLPGVVGGCQAAPPILLCRRLDGRTALWRLRR
ncbi:PQQ-binding-like beta-propeller repeat protein [Micromonospora sp. U21]|uniref:outer membrane protein assembly factor BamB family protein n=1 Tax=Micromonospora sp. U21 TaxID=2824899 RepID=UPI001B39ADF6|nr:PQQ-binding-like beta-propeller repeat protein [Micromonospora sp. U21]MBQ0900921.1 PQQ-binding-like beta-propeller repeat protein [Micromonospora sp. U21]